MEQYDGPTVRRICAPGLDNISDDGVQQVHNLLMDINTHDKMYERHCNRLLLDVLDCGYVQGWRNLNIPRGEWAASYRVLTEKRRFNPDIHTEIHLPVML